MGMLHNVKPSAPRPECHKRRADYRFRGCGAFSTVRARVSADLCLSENLHVQWFCWVELDAAFQVSIFWSKKLPMWKCYLLWHIVPAVLH